MFRLLLIKSSPVVRVIVLLAGSAKVIVSPAAASRIACRNVPGPLFAVLVTVRVAALLTGGRASIRKIVIRQTPNSNDRVRARALPPLAVASTSRKNVDAIQTGAANAAAQSNSRLIRLARVVDE
jgi:hypothetical protein